MWQPTKAQIEKTRLYQWMKRLGYINDEDFHRASIENPDWFWHEVVRTLGVVWQKPYTSVLNMDDGIAFPKWFQDGTLNIVDSAVTKWTEDPHMRTKKALAWEGECGATIDMTYQALADNVEKLAAGLSARGMKKGDIAGVLMPMTPEVVVIMLACAKLGVITTPIFSGYGEEAIATRLNACEASVLFTADGFYRRGNIISLKETADAAAQSVPSLKQMIVTKRVGQSIDWVEGRDVSYDDCLSVERHVATVAMKTDEPLMLLYTSGTTGRPKAAVHTHSGFPIKAAFDAGICMDVGREDALFWYTDMGWMMGPFLLYGALLNGATLVLYDGTPDYPQKTRLFDVAKKHQATHVGVSPTLIRSLMPHKEAVPSDPLEHVRVFASTGEPWNDDPWLWLYEKIGRKRIPIFNYSGGTEIGGGILGNVLTKPIGVSTFNCALPGMAAAVYDQTGQAVEHAVGELVLTAPWVGMTAGFWQERERYLQTYWQRFEHVWVHGDSVLYESGEWRITGRSDDVLTIAGKRVGPAEIETVLVSHCDVIEAAVIGVNDDVKGEAALAFVVVKDHVVLDEELMQVLQTLVEVKLGKSLRFRACYAVKALPKTRNGKVMRRLLKKTFLGEDVGDLSALENHDSLHTIRALRHPL
ncbi:AMP-binding protein [Bacillus sp. FSL W7-1360]